MNSNMCEFNEARERSVFFQLVLRMGMIDGAMGLAVEQMHLHFNQEILLVVALLANVKIFGQKAFVSFTVKVNIIRYLFAALLADKVAVAVRVNHKDPRIFMCMGAWQW
jgi:hypothetical protein